MASIIDRPSSSPSTALVSGEVGGEPTLRWFGPAWGLAILFHLMANGGHLASLNHIGLVQVVLAISAAAMLIRPAWTLAIWLAAVELVVLWLKLPRVGNHEVILGLVSLAIGLSALIGRQRWMSMAAPTCRWLLLIAYGSIAFSKLNHDFLDPAVSCAVVFGDELGSWVGVQASESAVVGRFVVYGTAAVELCIPVLLLLRRTRNMGVALALGFHFLLAIDPIGHVWDFSSTLMPLFLLFAAPDVLTRLDRWLDLFLGRTFTERSGGVAVVVVGHWALLVGGAPDWLIAYPIWLALGGLVLGLAVSAAFTAPIEGRAVGLKVPPVLACVVAIAALNGASPYFELRSAAAFNMYSNLQVSEGVSNHLIVPSGLAVRDPRLVEIVDATSGGPLAYYLDRDLLLPEQNVAHLLGEQPGVEALVSVDGSGAAPVASSVRPAPGGLLNTVGYKLGFRRAVDATEPVRCLREWGPIG